MTRKGGGSGIDNGMRFVVYGAGLLILCVFVWFGFMVSEHGWNGPEASERMQNMSWARGGWAADYKGDDGSYGVDP